MVFVFVCDLNEIVEEETNSGVLHTKERRTGKFCAYQKTMKPRELYELLVCRRERSQSMTIAEEEI